MKLTQNEIFMIASTPSTECWICDEIINHIVGGEIDDGWLNENGFRDHLRQVIGR